MKQDEKLFKEARITLTILKLLLLLLVGLFPISKFYIFISENWPEKIENLENIPPYEPIKKLASAPSSKRMHRADNEELIKYGEELIRNTAYYIGFKGTEKQITNGLNCQNCHLDGGQKPWGNNYLSVAANYPQIRKRSGKETDVYGRINGCLQRSLNGLPMDSTEKEMKAMAAYILWLGQDVTKGKKAAGSKVYPIEFLDRAADPIAGKSIYESKCTSCHQSNGKGFLAADGRSFVYPPLWGSLSYNDGAGLYRLSKFAGYVKMNMPFGVSHENPQLTDEEAWDLAAYVDSMPRPEKDKTNDWPNLADKPIDHPFGPFADPFSENQHKYGPFKPIKYWYENQKTIQ
ncbi:c-type cytochrome [Arcticibacterium luteifluviistationis]|uniref:Cytochrome C n=1 Tax=Arcticibacterium luteifluviistationis TaxID=1784714 RepID=A0A2Z4G822_9BACT|nr:c-type cytochrome [Arcticibacterium luteifluviistationis]AWV97228.1 cytochrome C [Arcticibacterium luteifluviistationis]